MPGRISWQTLRIANQTYVKNPLASAIVEDRFLLFISSKYGCNYFLQVQTQIKIQVVEV